MKTSHTRALHLLAVFAIVLVTPIFLSFGAAVPPEKRGGLVFCGLFLGLSCAVLAIVIADKLQADIPNGKPRPGDELPRKQLFKVHSRGGNRLLLWTVPTSQAGEKPVYWEFEDLPLEVEPEKTIVYLDDLESEYLAAWKEKGVIPIVSAKGRKSTDEKFKKHFENVREIVRQNT